MAEHHPSWMPFPIPWTDFESPELERNAQQHWRNCRAGTSPEPWELNLAIVVDGAAVGITSIGATDFGIVGTFHTGSWLGRSSRGHGIGTEMRTATLHLGFAGFGAARATTARDDIELVGIDGARELLGIAAPRDDVVH